MQGVPDTPPLPEPADEARRRQSRLRRRIVSGVWKDDLERKCRQFFPGATVERFGTVDCSRNLLRVVTRQLAVRYTRPWRIDAEGADLDQLDAALRDAGAMGVAAGSGDDGAATSCAHCRYQSAHGDEGRGNVNQKIQVPKFVRHLDDWGPWPHSGVKRQSGDGAVFIEQSLQQVRGRLDVGQIKGVGRQRQTCEFTR